jgi:phage terminase small subunit|tara:strand:+ start:1886 stop:2461 length:576 start_codon:yes stop_codon:yes gene_type:complete
MGKAVVGQKNLRKLTRRQEKFVKELVSNDGLQTLRESAIKAGYPVASAHTRAYELTNERRCPHVVAEIKRYRNELDEKYGVNYKRHIRDLQIIRNKAMEDGAYSAAVMAEKNRGLAEGLYVSKSEIRTGSIDQMSREDVEKELERIRSNFEEAIEIEAVEVTESGSSGSDEQGIGAVEDNKGGYSENGEED